MDKALAHDDSILQAREVLEHDFVVLDTETTGLQGAEVVQLGLVTKDGAVFDALVKPLVPIDPAATAVHGITNEMVANRPTVKQYWPSIAPMLRLTRIIGYNVKYDIDAINLSLKHADLSDPEQTIGRQGVFDVMLCYAAFVGEVNPKYGTFKWHKLGEALAQCKIVVEGKGHNAVVDAQATLVLLHYIADQTTTWELAIISALQKDADPGAFEQAVEWCTYGRFK